VSPRDRPLVLYVSVAPAVPFQVRIAVMLEGRAALLGLGREATMTGRGATLVELYTRASPESPPPACWRLSGWATWTLPKSPRGARVAGSAASAWPEIDQKLALVTDRV